MITQTKPRSVLRTSSALRTTEGAGVPIGRAFPTRGMEELDPFLLLDHMGPLVLKPGQNLGFPDHPHRGFETVTYLLSGQMEHKDSFGNRGFLEAGDVQWMTAGSGLVHSEMPGRDLVRTGGRLEGFQLWINLPKRDKMMPPRYQELKADQIPASSSPNGDVKVRVIAGESLGVKGVIESRTPILYLHLTLAAGASHQQAVPSSFQAFAYVIRGKEAGSVIVFDHHGDEIVIENDSAEPRELLLIAGEPINEPVARYGPFVMNTREELVQAFEDYREGKMGTIS